MKKQRGLLFTNFLTAIASLLGLTLYAYASGRIRRLIPLVNERLQGFQMYGHTRRSEKRKGRSDKPHANILMLRKCSDRMVIKCLANQLFNFHVR
jgi:hypothetical protein